MERRTFLLMLVAAVVATGCATGGISPNYPDREPGDTTLYVIRTDYDLGGGWAGAYAPIILDGEEVAYLKRMDYVSIPVDPESTHTITTTFKHYKALIEGQGPHYVVLRWEPSATTWEVAVIDDADGERWLQRAKDVTRYSGPDAEWAWRGSPDGPRIPPGRR